jgi:acyl-CoA synthetase
MRHGAVARCAAFPVADQRLGEKVCLAVILHEGETVQPDELLAHLHDAGLSRYDMPEYFLAMAAFPLTASGKILKRELVQWAKEGRIQPTSIRWSDPSPRPPLAK